MDASEASTQLGEILDRLSYEVTAARAAGVDRPEELRAALKRARDLVADADALSASLGAESLKSSGWSPPPE